MERDTRLATLPTIPLVKFGNLLVQRIDVCKHRLEHQTLVRLDQAFQSLL
jgi:hypothetical protein